MMKVVELPKKPTQRSFTIIANENDDVSFDNQGFTSMEIIYCLETLKLKLLQGDFDE